MKKLIVLLVVFGMASVASAAYTDVTDNTCLYHFDDPLVSYFNPDSGETYDYSADDNSSGRLPSHLRMGHPDAGPPATLTTGNQGSSGAVGDEALDMNRDGFAFNAGTLQPPSEAWPFASFTNKFTLDFDLYLRDLSGPANHPTQEWIVNLSGPLQLYKSGDDLLLRLHADDNAPAIDGMFYMTDWYLDSSNQDVWQHVSIEYDNRDVTFTVGDDTMTGTLGEDLWARTEAQLFFGYSHGGSRSTRTWGFDGLLDEVKLTVPEPITIGLLGLGAALIRRKK